MKKEVYDTHFKYGQLMDCACLNIERMSFVLKDYPHDDEDNRELLELPTRAITYRASLPTGEYGISYWSNNIDLLHIEIDKERDKTIMVTQSFQTIESGISEWYNIPNSEKGYLAQGLANIDGQVYAFGMVRSVFKYIHEKQWENITTKTKHPNLYTDVEASKETFVGDWVGFSALDGFSHNDIYAGGNRGDCWHYDGTKWTKVDLPLNADISSITCAPNGIVYIGCRTGSVLAGREDKWVNIDESKQITHSAWFDERIYFASENGRIYTHNMGDKELKEASFKTQHPDYMHHLISGISACEECLVVYTGVQAYAYDGENWHEVIELPSLSKNR